MSGAIVFLVIGVPTLVGLAIVAVKTVEFALNRDLVATQDITRTVIAIVGLGIATVVGGFVMAFPDINDTGPGFTWWWGIGVLIVLGLVERGWIRAVCRPRPR